ncbi:MAG: DeoR family transcriptional regulator [Desulfotalea sp.]|nr:MAG: DeoR family transcriptional regulator [Desulfotalea sp.]
MSLTKEKRKNDLVELLSHEEMIHLADLSRLLGVSEMTSRRYIAELSPSVRLLGSYAMLPRESAVLDQQTYLVDIETDRNREKKLSIGRAAAALIEENDVIFIDCGTTTPFIAHYISNELNFKGICCSLNIFNLLNAKKNSKILLTGGAFHEKTQVFSSPQALDMIRQLRITKAFVSAAGISQQLGLTCFNQYEIELKREVMKVSQHVYIVADSSKFDQVKMAYFADVDQVDTVITNEDISATDESWLRQLNINLIKT